MVATYMNLKPGIYISSAKVSHNDNVWTGSPVALKIEVLPSLWKSWWACILCVIILIVAFISFLRLVRIRLKTEQNLYIEQMENKKQSELDQSKLSFFNNISQDLLTPLTLIIDPIENLINETSEDEVRKQLQSVQANANRLLRLVNQLLDFRKQETGNLKLKVEESNIVKFISEINLAFQEFAKLKKISLEFKCELKEIKAWFDREEMEKVLFNLLSNSFKYTPEGGKINISVREIPSGELSNGFVEVVIEDNGIGIPKEHLDKVFDRFYQVENTSLPNHGFGIGLALTKGIIELHHGSVTVESKVVTKNMPGYTRFMVKLQLGHAHFEEDEIIKDDKTSELIDSYILLEKEAEGHEPEYLTKNTQKEEYVVLIVEDNLEIRNYLKNRLKQAYTIKEASNGLEAWEIASETLPDLILSDAVMPVMDGITLTNRLKSDERTNHIQIILIIERNTTIHQMEGLETGADEYITRPFNIGLLELKIRNLLLSREKLRQKYSRIITLDPKYEEISNPNERFLQRLLMIVETQIAEPEFNVSRLVIAMGMSRPVLFRKIKALTNLSVMELIKSTRLKKAAMLLKQKRLTISEVAFAVGFSDPKYFSKAFRSHFGKSPSNYMADADKLS
jgi:signal transduction histidine kinase/DNA-binding response OmpR family regulator